jgi:tetratricopeptide (TPR) repeat protein
MIYTVFAFNFAGGNLNLKSGHTIFQVFILCCTLLWAAGCAPQRKNFFSKTYHNTTALYNAYFIAREDIRMVEAAIEASHRNDYDRLLPVFSDIDSATIGTQREVLDDCLKKASLAIQRHENSKWVDDSYYLVGKARFYGGDFVNAIETFKYINTRSDDDHQRHAALVALMRTFIHYGEMNNAQAVSDFLQKQRLNRENLLELYLTRAYLYQLAGDRRQLAHNLSEAVQLQGNKKKNARHYYILGQIHQDEGRDDEAYGYFRKCLKSSTEYELSFYARINMARSSRAGQPVDDKKVQRFFSKMLKDSKNREFRDRIFFEMARYELRRGNTETGIDYLKSAAREATPNSRIRPMAFLRLAEIYYGETKNFVLAKAYYDSTVAVFPREDERFPEIESRQKILGEFVAQLETIHTQDSLLRLAAMDPAELDALLDRVILEKREREEALARQQEIEARRQNSSQAPFGDEPWAAAGPAARAGRLALVLLQFRRREHGAERIPPALGQPAAGRQLAQGQERVARRLRNGNGHRRGAGGQRSGRRGERSR